MTAEESEVCSAQAPLRRRFQEDPAAAFVTDRAKARGNGRGPGDRLQTQGVACERLAFESAEPWLRVDPAGPSL